MASYKIKLHNIIIRSCSILFIVSNKPYALVGVDPFIDSVNTGSHVILETGR